ncbi:MAG: winged helix-turn-helix domain-containing protein [Oscillospiraceae bacterium]|nr:winged helix-turn-helix domain-containing protein [Oscillospiraceae bacterium]
MERDYGREIDEIKEQIGEMSRMIMQANQRMPKRGDAKPLQNIRPMRNMHPDTRISELMEELCEKADTDGNTGAVTYFGVFSSGGRQSNWIRHQVDTDALLKLIESNTAGKVLACIGSNDRLNMLLALLRSPKTAAQLVEQCGYNTTGQVYHHLKPLLAADLVMEDGNSRGSYTIIPHRVQGIIMLLAGISDILDPQYTQGDWAQEAPHEEPTDI